jgi:glycosyltransferase involved in cell wall biosynthesis
LEYGGTWVHYGIGCALLDVVSQRPFSRLEDIYIFKMRILNLYAGNLFGGIENMLLTLARCVREVPEASLLFGLCFEDKLSQELRALGMPVHMLGEVRVRWPWTVWRARHRLRTLLAREQPDIVICHSCWPHVLFAPVVRAQNLHLAFWAHDYYRGRHWLERWSRWTSPDIILANSWFTQSFMDNLFPGVHREVIYPPVTPFASKDRENNRIMIRRELRTPEDAVVIVQACRLERLKGHNLLLDALGRLASLPRWVCWIAGGVQRPHEKTYLEELRRKTIALGIEKRVHFLGQRADVPALLAAADIHCQPNTGPEPFGITFVEALYAGLPVVTTALGGALEIIDERCGILVPPDDPKALAAALERLVRDRNLRAQLGSCGPERAGRLCDPSIQVRKLLAILQELVQCRTTT